jgi:putative intracellular protease/amidase
MIRVEVITESWRSTFRATPLRPLVVVTGGLIVIAIVTSWRSARAPDLFGIGAAALAAAVALGLDDEANTMLRSSPTNALARVVHRLAILVPALCAATVTLLVADRVLFAERSPLPSASALAALVAAGIAVEVWWGRRRPETSAEGAATFVMAWVLAASLVPDVWIVERIARAWELDAPLVLVVSFVLVVGGTIGRGA